MISATIIADSVSPLGDRLTTMELEYPRFIHSEIMTHRVFSRNAASSRAIPTKKLIEQVRTNPAMPTEWGSNKPGMQAGPEVLYTEDAEYYWRQAANDAAWQANHLFELGVHKQVVNRLLEPFMWMKTIVSSTEWDNFFDQRISPHAQPELCQLAILMRDELRGSEPVEIKFGDWHTPYMSHKDKMNFSVPLHPVGISAARCARVSYLNHGDGRELAEDMKLYERLRRDGHWSPLEHVATPWHSSHSPGNFAGWKQLRHLPEYQ